MILVTGAGGFIGGHLVGSLLKGNVNTVRAIDSKPAGQWYQFHEDAENYQADLANPKVARQACHGVESVYNLAADMGGIGFIENSKAACMLSVLPSTNMLVAARDQGVSRFFYSSSACVYAADKQTDPNVTALKEEDAYPAQAEDGYGWEKLFTERMCRHFYEDFGLETRVARYHNVYGPYGTYDGGREKAPAALCRKIAVAKASGEKEISMWGDGEQTRSFMYVDDCVDGTRRIMAANFRQPLNLGSDELVSINQLAGLIAQIAGMTDISIVHELSAPQGVRGRNSDNTLIQRELGWAPSISLQTGLEKTYRWISDHIQRTSSHGHRRAG